MEPGVIDLNDMTDEQLSELVEDARRELAGRQTKDAVVRDVTGAVDPIIRENRDLLGGSWTSGRVSWDGESMTVAAPPNEEPAPAAAEAVVVAPEPVAWAGGDTLKAGAHVTHGGRTFEVVQSHIASIDRMPGDTPALYKEV